MEDIAGGVKSIEDEAEKILQQARNKGGEIVARAREESQQIISSELSLETVRAECKAIISRANTESEKQITEAREKARKIVDNVSSQMDVIIRKMVNIVTGTESL